MKRKPVKTLVTLVEDLEKAHTKYVEQDWDEAERMFRQLKDKDP
jgi:hypothetical protein